MTIRPEPPERATEPPPSSREAVQRWRLVVRRDTPPGDIPQRGQQADWEAAITSTGLPVAGLDLPRPKLRLAIAAPLAGGIPGEAELVDLWLVERLPRWRVREALRDGLPVGHSLVDLYDVWLGEPPLPGRVVASVYRAELGPEAQIEALAAAASGLLAAAALPRERRKGDTAVRYDLRPFLVSIEVGRAPSGAGLLRMTLRHDPAKGVGRPDETLAALGEAMGRPPLRPLALVREALVLAPLPSPEPPASRPSRRLPLPRPPRTARAPGGPM